MSKKAKNSSRETSFDQETSRRTLLKRALLVLGAGAIVQVSGGVSTLQATPKKEGSKTHKGTAKFTNKTTVKTTHKTTGETSTFVNTSTIKEERAVTTTSATTNTVGGSKSNYKVTDAASKSIKVKSTAKHQ